MIDWRKAAGSKADTSGRRIVPRMCFRLQVQRLPRPILIRVIVWMCLLGILSLFMFAIPAEAIADRLNYAVTMVLAVVAFQFVINSIIPNVPYLTLVDKYNLMIFAFLFFATVEGVFISSGAVSYGDELDDDFFTEIDRFFVKFYVILFIVAHVIWIIAAIVIYKKEEAKIKQPWGMVGKDGDCEPVSIMSFNRDKFYKQGKNAEIIDKLMGRTK